MVPECLAGDPVNLVGTVNVTGDVRSDARLDISGTVTINTAGQPLRLSGGLLTGSTNRLIGGSISGAGLLGADNQTTLAGFGTIHTGIDFDNLSNLTADDGTLTINGAILDMNVLSALDDGILRIPAAWDSGSVESLELAGGKLTGGAVTLSNVQGLRGRGTVEARIVNNSRIQSTSSIAPLVFQTTANDNDWDGTGNAGILAAGGGSILELRDNATFGFTGGVQLSGASTLKTVGFALAFNPGSSVALANSVLQSDATTNIGGSVTVNAGGESRIKVALNSLLIFEDGSATTLNGNLSLENNNIRIQPTATFSGNGALVIPAGSRAATLPGANANVLFINHGTLEPGGLDTAGRTDVRDFQQSATGELSVEITGTNLNQFDRLIVNGSAQLGGHLTLDMDGGFVPVAGQSFIILSASAGVSGQFSQIDMIGVPAGVTFNLTYQANSVTATVINGSPYDGWIESFASLTNAADRLKSADPDHDGVPNLAEYALGGDPTKGTGTPNVHHRIANVSGVPALTLTVPVRSGGSIFSTTPMQLRDSDNVYKCFVEASDDLEIFNLAVTQVPPADQTAIQATLPPAPAGYTYFTFRSPGPIEGDAREFMRLRITE
ncbi:MAG: hypothetical protein EOP83_16775 [Verrucomicrobiaceae bacterium]|nr:MAG: hypothetical protein EOP83_16775 [Verrucomicrobiaceae bacterium]